MNLQNIFFPIYFKKCGSKCATERIISSGKSNIRRYCQMQMLKTSAIKISTFLIRVKINTHYSSIRYNFCKKKELCNYILCLPYNLAIPNKSTGETEHAIHYLTKSNIPIIKETKTETQKFCKLLLLCSHLVSIFGNCLFTRNSQYFQ